MSKLKILSINTLKIIGLISMVFDHIGMMLYPGIFFFRIIGRIAYPIFAFALVEGCFYTKNRLKHFLTIFIMAILIQVVYYIAMKDYSLSIFMIFSFSIILIYLFDFIYDKTMEIFNEENENKTKSYLLWILGIFSFIALIGSIIMLDIMTPYVSPSYGYQGVLIPVIIYIIMRFNNHKLYISYLVLAVLLALMAVTRKEYYNFYTLLAIPFLLLYNGLRGKYNLKYLFYVFYPAHILVIYGISLLIK